MSTLGAATAAAFAAPVHPTAAWLRRPRAAVEAAARGHLAGFVQRTAGVSVVAGRSARTSPLLWPATAAVARGSGGDDGGRGRGRPPPTRPADRTSTRASGLPSSRGSGSGTGTGKGKMSGSGSGSGSSRGPHRAVERERLHKLLARAGVCSRRAAEQLVVEGRVTVNRVVVEPNRPCLVNSFTDHVSVDGRPVSFVKPTPVWIALHKPKGYISTVEDDRGRRTVMDLVKHARKNALVPVGRLDSQSTGLLILTNERAQVHELTHPSSLHVKEYIVDCEGHVTDEKLKLLRNGILLEGENRPTLPADVEILEKGYANIGSKSTAMTKLEFRIREGRNRQIRRMCDAVENPVLSLKRVAFGPVRLDSRLRRGDSRPLTPNEIKALKRGVGASADRLRTRKLIRT